MRRTFKFTSHRIFFSPVSATRWWLWASASRAMLAIRCVWGNRRRCRRKMNSTCSFSSRRCLQSSRCCRDQRRRQRRVRRMRHKTHSVAKIVVNKACRQRGSARANASLGYCWTVAFPQNVFAAAVSWSKNPRNCFILSHYGMIIYESYLFWGHYAVGAHCSQSPAELLTFWRVKCLLSFERLLMFSSPWNIRRSTPVQLCCINVFAQWMQHQGKGFNVLFLKIFFIFQSLKGSQK